jgi:uncharacterized UPF0160 family protein
MIKIQTHNGKIHADEVASVALLTSYFSKNGKTISIIRSRIIDETADIYVDVGLEYDHSKGKYDHHQKDFSEIWDNSLSFRKLSVSQINTEKEVYLSSAGLIWRHYGKEIVELYLSNNADEYDESFNYSEETISDLVNIIYYKLIRDIDAEDNGIELDSFTKLNLGDLVNSLNCEDSCNEEIQNENFCRAVSLIGEIFDIKFKEIINGYLNFQKDIETLQKMDLSGPYLIINEHIPTIFKCLNKLDSENKIKFCIFCNSDKPEYTIKTRRNKGNKFNPLCPIDVSYSLNNSDKIIFIHPGKFLAKTLDLETAIKIVEMSLQLYKENTLTSEVHHQNNTNNINDVNDVNNTHNEISQIHIEKVFPNKYLYGLLGMSVLVNAYLFLKD